LQKILLKAVDGKNKSEVLKIVNSDLRNEERGNNKTSFGF